MIIKRGEGCLWVSLPMRDSTWESLVKVRRYDIISLNCSCVNFVYFTNISPSFTKKEVERE
jgi:hypothetical protein